MTKSHYLFAVLTTSAVLTACSSSLPDDEHPTQKNHSHHNGHSHNGHSHNNNSNRESHVPLQSASTLYSQINLSLFNPSAMSQTPEIVSCTLENGLQSECAQMTVKYKPDDLEVGPFCPKSLDEDGGIWQWDGDKEGLYRLDGEFFEMLKAQGYSFYNDEGQVFITGDGAKPKYPNTCINMRADKEVEMTLLIPTNPMKAATPNELGTVSKVGISLSGVPIFSDAPSVLRTGHLPALDTCAGHVDPGGWYHYHGTASDINTVYEKEGVQAECQLTQSSSALFGYAFDGIGIYGSTEENGEEPTDLDACNGHVGYVPNKLEKVYHYHASTNFPNLPKCLIGVMAKNNFSTTAKAGVGAEGVGAKQGQPPEQGRPDRRQGGNGQEVNERGMGIPPGFEEAATKLGITADELFNALNNAGGPNANLAEVAKVLGVSEAELKAALPEPPPRR
ncbi:YHYH protein [Marinomonas sp. C2222]|uniref:YHYH protein n=1 Tax=Marinomonas sargassi TaxID=2984494 RepID=A0ABT2YSR4_9GAMM|nr:YHYH protein [Marinomonas sargassi]MCV2402674.1 YHYH protein [Marinomonas sargassi]